MRTFFAAVLGVIAVGVMLIAYGLLSPRVAAAPGDIVTLDSRGAAAYQTARPVYASERVAVPADPYVDARDPRAYPAYAPASARPAYAPASARPVYASQAPAAPQRQTRPVINDGAPRFGGKKGALIGAAIGGGGSTLWEAIHK
ncbi:MAG: hypothetical protein DMG03_22845 [Acidobacteria bacterium]|nr:MAG: hypothetical protein DMG03_22845 [Acidobacteriota bacterium]